MTVLAPRERTLPRLLERGAERFGERELLRASGRSLSFVDVRELASRRAAQLAAEGIAPGDVVAAMSDDRPTVLELWLGCSWLGAAYLPVNTALKGTGLEHVLADSGACALVIDGSLRDRLEAIERPPALERLWTLDGGVDALPPPADPVPAHACRPGDTSAVLYTSGTTGPAKGVLCPQAQWYWWAVVTGRVLGVGEGDILATCLPLFHTNALNTFCQALLAGGTFVPGPRFSASRFWDWLAAEGATVTYLLGPMASILLRTPPSAGDRAHAVSVALAPASPTEVHGPFRDRFGVELIDGWGSTETNFVLANERGAVRPGSLGRCVPEFEAQVVDNDDEPVLDGTPGELVVRSRVPYAFATGYVRPEPTVAAWRNLWHHTGDRVVRDADGSFRFVDRIKDVIRRRGENVSSFEVEQVLMGHPDVALAAAVPVPAELGEDEVLAFVVPRAGTVLDPAKLIRWCEPRLAYFAVPRFIELMEQLPQTPSGKVEKQALRERGLTATTWDREAAGVTVER
jgi:carnitine-CoA ligase